MEHGCPGSKEVTGTSQWLADNGMLPATTAASDNEEEETVVGVMEGAPSGSISTRIDAVAAKDVFTRKR